MTRNEWTTKIKAHYGKAVEALIETGLDLIEAKRELPHGEWIAMIESDLPFPRKDASGLMLVARRFKLEMGQSLPHLPQKFSILEILASFSNDELDAMIADGTINKNTTWNQAGGLRKKAIAKKREAKQPKLREDAATAIKNGAHKTIWNERVKANYQPKWETPEVRKVISDSFAGVSREQKDKYPWVITAPKDVLDKQLARAAIDALIISPAKYEAMLQRFLHDVQDALKNHFLPDPETFAANVRPNFVARFKARFQMLEAIYKGLQPYGEAIRAKTKDAA